MAILRTPGAAADAPLPKAEDPYATASIADNPPWIPLLARKATYIENIPPLINFFPIFLPATCLSVP